MTYNDTSFCHPQTPPIPAQHPSLQKSATDSHINTASSATHKAPINNPVIKSGGLSGIPVMKKTRNVQVNALDRTKVLDHKSRAKLDLDPKIQSVDALGHDFSENTIFSEPMHNSSIGIHRQINHIKSCKFDPAEEMSRYVVHCQDGMKNLKIKVTAKSLNSKRTLNQYSGLQKIDKVIKNQSLNLMQNQGSNKARSIPRAKKSTSQSWLDALDSKPDLEAFSPRPLEVDTICLPFPQILDNPFLASTGNPSISISSFLVNYEESFRWIMYENSITSDDI